MPRTRTNDEMRHMWRQEAHKRESQLTPPVDPLISILDNRILLLINDLEDVRAALNTAGQTHLVIG